MVRKAADSRQFTLDFEPGLTERHTSLRDCIATGVYQRGLSRVAIDLDESHGNLSVKLSESPTRHLSVEDFEAYLAKSHDMTPIYYLVEKFLQQPDIKQNAALAQLPALMEQMAAVMKAAGVRA